MRIFPFRSIETTCPTWRKARAMIEQRIPKPLEFRWENDKRIAVGTNTAELDELWNLAPPECVEDMRARIYTMMIYLHHAMDLDGVRSKFLDRPGHVAVLDAMNGFLRNRDDQRRCHGLATFDELIRHALGVKECTRPLQLIVEVSQR